MVSRATSATSTGSKLGGQRRLNLLMIVIAVVGMEKAFIGLHAWHIVMWVDAENAIHLIRPPHRAGPFVEAPGTNPGDALRFMESLEQQGFFALAVFSLLFGRLESGFGTARD
jgi:hypothetical protein